MSVLNKKLTINEIFYSIQGESYLSGLPCIFIRLTGCHQRCTYCDTEYAFFEGEKQTILKILDQIKEFPCRNVLVTGGEPLLQDNAKLLMQQLLDDGYQVAVETGGNRDISNLPAAVIRVMDLKTPGSGEMHRNRLENLKCLTKADEVKFVVTDSQDVEWAVKQVCEHDLDSKCHVSMSPTKSELHTVIADQVLKSGRIIRQQMQMHKVIWPKTERGY